MNKTEFITAVAEKAGLSKADAKKAVDVMFNSAMPYEPCVLKPFVEPILFQVTEADPEYQEANRLLKFMNYFLPCGYENVPIDSILREFVGGGCFKV